MRIHILFASAAALVACGGSTAPLSSDAPDASSNVAMGHVGQVGPASTTPRASHAPLGPARLGPARGGAVEPQGPERFPESGGSSSGGVVVDAGTGSDASTASSSFPCGSGSTTVMCAGSGYFCKMTSTGSISNASCEMATGCPSSGANCGCVDPFDGGTGCTCADNGGHVTLTCPY